MHVLLTQFGESASGIGALGVDVKALVIQLVSFVLAFLVLKKWAFGPIVRMMEQRRATIEQGVKLGEQMQKDKAKLDAQIADTLQKARSEADGIIAQAQDTSRQTVREAEDKARDKAAGILKDAEERIATDTARARKKLESEVVGLISEATEAIIGEKVDAKKDAQLIDRALKEQNT